MVRRGCPECARSRVKSKIVKSVFAASLQSSKHLVVRANTCCFRNQDIVSEWINIFTLGLLFQCASTIKARLSI
jgi:hypothetical protein